MVAATTAVRRAGLAALIKQSPGLKYVGSVQTVAHLVQQARDLQPDVVVVDFDRSPALPPQEMPIVALIDDHDARWAAHALRSGVRAILPRDADMDAILPAIQAAHAGLVLLDATVSETLAAQIRVSADPSGDEVLEELTPREIDVLEMLAEGMSNREMATRLGISEHTVKFHISSILGKLGAATRTEAVTLGIRQGLIVL